MAYKKTKAVEVIELAIDKYLQGMAFAGKKPSKIYLTSKQVQTLLDDRNKLARDKNPDSKQIAELDQVKGYLVGIYNP